LVEATDPSNWHKHSDVFEKSEYVKSPFDFVTVNGPPTDGTRAGLLNEKVAFSWGDDPDQRGTFHNVLNVRRTILRPGDRPGEGKPPEKYGSITINFSLCRSISSALLWDRRLGGIEVDSGFIKVRHLARDTSGDTSGDTPLDTWRVTYKKYLQFSDRTPNSYGSDWTDLGQMLNYFAPAALTWWMESETYSIGEFSTNKLPETQTQ
jgi:hypothetical protein